MDQIMVSVICMVYNHANYLEKCIQSLVAQETSFEVEVIIHDDASTDGSAEIIRQYAELYPDMIIPIFQSENQLSKHVGIAKTFIVPRIRGKYVAFCEGDDFWTDTQKLQKQVQVMEKNTDVLLCVHTVGTCEGNGDALPEKIPKDPSIVPERILSRDFIKMVSEKYAFQTSSYMIRANEYIQYRISPPRFVQVSPVGDQCMMYYFGDMADVCFIKDEMSCYRRFAKDSWTSRNRNPEQGIKNHTALKKMVIEYDYFTNHKYEDILKDRMVFHDYLIATYQKAYRELLKPKYRKLLKEESIKYRLYVWFCAFSPVTEKLRSQIRKRGS